MPCPRHDARSGKIVLVCHCLLNANAKVCGLAKYAGVQPGVAELFVAKGIGLVQLPCPELLHMGHGRWWQSRSQYDVPAYRDLCARLAAQAADQVAAYSRAGYAVLGCFGVEGSPSCGVREVYDTDDWGGRPREIDTSSCRIKGTGLFVQAMQRALEEHGVTIPFIGVPAAGDMSPDDVERLLDDMLAD